METPYSTHYTKSFGASSYPTYEEWKPILSPFVIPSSSSCSYPTYEEWKLDYESPVSEDKECSYPTYEEWKHA